MQRTGEGRWNVHVCSQAMHSSFSNILRPKKENIEAVIITLFGKEMPHLESPKSRVLF